MDENEKIEPTEIEDHEASNTTDAASIYADVNKEQQTAEVREMQKEAYQQQTYDSAAPGQVPQVPGQVPHRVLTSSLDGEGNPLPVELPDAVARHQPPAEAPVREFADHMDRAQQAVKDWVRKELGLLVQGKSHDERVSENP